MRLALIGFGQAGGKIVDKLLEYEHRTGRNIIGAALAFNSAKADLLGLEWIPEENRHLIGEARVKGHGVGADNELGAEITEQEIDEIQSAIDQISIYDIDAFLIVAGLGGGTGSGGAPVLAKHLKRLYTEPVYGLGVLPSTKEGGIYTLNAARSFQTFVDEVDNLLLFDNDAWRQTGESMEAGYDEINDEIARRFGMLFGAGEVEPGDEIAESVVDSSEIINTLSGGGISSLGFAQEYIEQPSGGLLSRCTGGGKRGVDSTAATNRITSLVRKATLGRLTLPVELEGIERALVVVAGPPEHLNRKGIEHSRKWTEEQTGSMEVRGGDYPMRGADHVSVAVLLSDVTNVPRIKELQRAAIEAQENMDDLRKSRNSRFEELVEDHSEELESLF